MLYILLYYRKGGNFVTEMFTYDLESFHLWRTTRNIEFRKYGMALQRCRFKRMQSIETMGYSLGK